MFITLRQLKDPTIEDLNDKDTYSESIYKAILQKSNLFFSKEMIRKYEQMGLTKKPGRLSNEWRYYSKKLILKNIEKIRKHYLQKGRWKKDFEEI
jgi:hypothetical protein